MKILLYNTKYMTEISTKTFIKELTSTCVCLGIPAIAMNMIMVIIKVIIHETIKEILVSLFRMKTSLILCIILVKALSGKESAYMENEIICH